MQSQIGGEKTGGQDLKHGKHKL